MTAHTASWGAWRWWGLPQGCPLPNHNCKAGIQLSFFFSIFTRKSHCVHKVPRVNGIWSREEWKLHFCTVSAPSPVAMTKYSRPQQLKGEQFQLESVVEGKSLNGLGTFIGSHEAGNEQITLLLAPFSHLHSPGSQPRNDATLGGWVSHLN